MKLSHLSLPYCLGFLGTNLTNLTNLAFKHQLPSYLDEFNWQRVYPGERFEMMLQHIAELYPVNDQLVSSFYCL